MTYAYVFGPVASSRLGRSLGLDLLGRRICSMDCLYCEVGSTDTLTTERAPWVPADVLLGELAQWAAEHPERPDHLTLGGSGEPCLNSDLATIIAGCRRIMPGVPVAVLTNATLLDRADVRADLASADVVLPSLDSLVESEFRRINRTCGGITAHAVAGGILDFARDFSGRIWLEVLLLQGVNDTPENLALLTDFVRELAPDRVDVTTLSRPGTWPGARPADRETLAAWRTALNAAARPAGGHAAPAAAAPSLTGRTAPDAPSTGPSSADAGHAGGLTPDGMPRITNGATTGTGPDVATDVVESLRRRPQTVGQLAQALARPEDALRAEVETLARAGRIRPVTDGLTHSASGEVFWTARHAETGE